MPQRWLRFKNESGEPIPAFGIIRLDGLITVDGETVLSGKKSNAYGSQWSHAVNGPSTVADDAYGVCTLDFPAWAGYSAGTPAVGELWGPVDDAWKLEQYVGGFRVLGTDTANKRLFVAREPLLEIEGFLDQDLDASSSSGQTETNADVSVWHGDGVNWQDSGSTVNVVNRDDSFEGASGNYIRAAWINNEWRPSWTEC